MQTTPSEFAWYSGNSSQPLPQQQSFNDSALQFNQFSSNGTPINIDSGSNYSLTGREGSWEVGKGTPLMADRANYGGYSNGLTFDSSNSGSASNPLGVPSAGGNQPSSSHPPSDTVSSTATSSDNLHQPRSGSSPSSVVGIHDAPSQSSSNLSDNHDAIPPLSTTNSSSTLPANPSSSSSSSTSSSTVPVSATAASSSAVNPNSSSTPSTATTTGKAKKPHKGIKERFHDWKAKRHGKGGSALSTAHPKDTRNGKELPSEDELAKMTKEPGGDASGPALHKDPNDATGKSITGSDANPSTKSNPFKVPVPGVNHSTGAPVEAKAQ